MLVAAVSLPGAAVIAVLWALGRLDDATAGIAAIVCVALTALAATPAALSLAVVRDAIDKLGAQGALAGRLTPATHALARAWRGAESRGDEARARLAAAEAVLAASARPADPARPAASHRPRQRRLGAS